MSLKRMYCYLFYTFYRFYEKAPSRWLSDWKAAVTLIALEIWVLITIMVYYTVFTKKELLNDNGLVIVGGIAIGLLALIKYYVFFHDDRWKEYVRDFDGLRKNKNRSGRILVWAFVFVILFSFIFSFYLMSRINWNLYR